MWDLKSNPHKVVRHTLISLNKRVSVRKSVQTRVLLEFHMNYNYFSGLCFSSCFETRKDWKNLNISKVFHVVLRI